MIHFGWRKRSVQCASVSNSSHRVIVHRQGLCKAICLSLCDRRACECVCMCVCSHTGTFPWTHVRSLDCQRLMSRRVEYEIKLISWWKDGLGWVLTLCIVRFQIWAITCKSLAARTHRFSSMTMWQRRSLRSVALWSLHNDLILPQQLPSLHPSATKQKSSPSHSGQIIIRIRWLSVR